MVDNLEVPEGWERAVGRKGTIHHELDLLRALVQSAKQILLLAL